MTKYLLSIVFAVCVSINARAQCPGCAPVNCAATNPDGGLCDTILIGMANHPLDENISFYMPKQVYTTLLPGGGYVQLDRIQVTAVAGLPLGLNWESNHSGNGNQYYPQTGDTIGCVRMCGTPIQADTFPLTVYLLADVTAPVVGQVKNQQQTYSNAVVIILPDTSGGVSTFTVTPFITSSCDPLSLTFDANLTNPTNPVIYQWNFGNGNSSALKSPPAQDFTAPGEYKVSLVTTIREYVLRRVRIVQVNGNWTGDIEELTAFLNAPDLIFKIPEIGYTSSEKTNAGLPATWQNLSVHLPVGTSQFTIEIYDKDNGPPLGSPDDFLGSAVINVAAGTFLWDDSAGTVTNGDVMIDDTVGSVFTDTLPIRIGTKPEVMLESFPADSICGGDTTTLYLTGTGIFQYTWFQDSVATPLVTDTFQEVEATGLFWVDVTSNDGCSAQTNTRQVTVIPRPYVPQFYFNPSSRLLYTVNHSGVTLIQWYKDGQVIQGSNSSSITLTESGNYKVEYFNKLGCSVMSEEKQITVTGILRGPLGQDRVMVVFPNPFEDNFSIRFPAGLNEDELILSLIDYTGREVFNKRISAFGNSDALTVQAPGLPGGIYLLRVLSTNQRLIALEKVSSIR